MQGYYFTRWINKCVANGMTGTDTQFKGDESDFNRSFKEIFTINKENNPDDVDSKFSKHKRKAIENQINDSLAQAIRNYAGESTQDYRLPLLTANDWDQILSNVSMVAFMQQIPVGFKVYNNYAIATSTNNREVVDPNEIYFINSTDNYYHRCYCDKTDWTTNLIGYRSVDFVEKIGYTYEDAGEEKTNYYFLHSDSTVTSSMACYYCLINRADYVKTDTHEINYEIAYNTALARERYKSKQDVILAKEYAEFEVEKTAKSATGARGTVALTDGAGNPIPGAYVEIGDMITWEIKIENTGKAGGKAYFYDKMPTGLKIDNVDAVRSKFIDDGKRDVTEDGIYGYIYVNAESSETIQIVTKVTEAVNYGELTNIVIIKNEDTSDISIDQASASVKAEKTVTIATDSGVSGSTFMVLVLDCSTSISYSERNGIKNAAKNVIKKLDEKNIDYSLISFAQGASVLDSINEYNLASSLGAGNGFSTNYVGALDLASEVIEDNSGYDNYYVVFMSDGGPTATQTTNHGFETKGPLEIFEFLRGTVEGSLLAVFGGWCECLWVSPGQYTMNWLLVEWVNEITNHIGFQIINVTKLADIIQGSLGPLDINNWVANNVWKLILNQVSNLGTLNASLVTMYFDNANIEEISNNRAYGLQQMAGTWDDGSRAFYESENVSDFENDLYNIINQIVGPEIPDEKLTSNLGKIKLDNVSSIKSITIGEIVLSSDSNSERFTQIKEDIINSESYNSTEDSGELNLNDYPEFKTTAAVTIAY